MDIVEMGAVPTQISVSAIRAARTPEECVAAGGIPKAPPPWSKKSFVCALPPRWLRERRGQTLVAGMGYFVKEPVTPPKGYVLARTPHPFWGRTREPFYQVVKPETARRHGWEIVKVGQCEMGYGMFADGALMVAIGAVVPVGAKFAIDRFVAPKSPKTAKWLKLGAGVTSVLPYFLWRKSPFTTGMMATGIAVLVEGVLDMIFGEKPITPEEALSIVRAGASPVTAMGQLTEEDIKELEEVSKELGVGQVIEEEAGELPMVMGQDEFPPPVIEEEEEGLTSRLAG